MFKTLVISSLLVLILNSVFAQLNLPIGGWRTHISYQNGKTLAILGDEIYCGSENGFFLYNSDEGGFQKLSKIEDFSNFSVQKIGADPATGTLIIAYTDGAIDVVKGEEIISVPALRESSISEKKIIHDIHISANRAFLSTNFGVVVLDLKKNEVKEVYRYIGFNGTQIEVFASTVFNDHLYLASSQGLMKGKLDVGVNLLFFDNWKTFSPDEGIPTGQVNEVASGAAGVFAGINNTGLFKLESEQWSKLNIPAAAVVKNIYIGDKILVCQDIQLLSIENELPFEITHDLIQAPSETGLDDMGNIWLADEKNGLLKISDAQVEQFIPAGPYSNNFFALGNFKEKIIGVPGGYSSFYEPVNLPGIVSIYENGQWNSIGPFNRNSGLEVEIGSNDIINDLSNVLVDKNGDLYLGSFRNGILVVKADGTTEVFNGSNSPLQSFNGEDTIIVGGMTIDFEDNLWVTNYGATSSIHQKKPGGEWVSYNFPLSRFPLQILVDFSGYKWVRLSQNQGGGILVFDEITQESRVLTSANGEGSLPDSKVNDLVMDKDGAIWCGTDKGIAVFFNSNVLEENKVDASLPIFQSRPLLRDEKVTCIEVDGGNRKWVGTENGLWLFNSDGTEVIYNFSTENSPLLSNIIRDISIVGKTGEVFIATDKGLVSFRSDATEATDIHEDVKVFPNPVEPGYKGDIAFSGLASNADLKITDVAGRLVYRMRAAGGTATWNLINLQGSRIKPGVYLVFSSSQSGEDTYVSKFAIIE